MTNKKEKSAVVGDDAILARAREIAGDRHIGLAAAMLEAEDELRALADDVPRVFAVSIPVKPRLARWILETFPPEGGVSTEARLAVWLGRHVLTRERVKALASAREVKDIGEGAAVTMPRHEFMRRAGQ